MAQPGWPPELRIRGSVLVLVAAAPKRAIEPVAEAVDRGGQPLLDLAHHLAVDVFAGDLLAIERERGRLNARRCVLPRPP
jgi:hypothetical protein